jgi:hypothetical protein
MHYLLEAGLVGLYSAIVYKIASFVLFDWIPLFFFVGFLKHALGYELSIHTLYCQYGSACSHLANKYDRYASSNLRTLVIESFQEGAVFVLLGYCLRMFSKDLLIVAFLTGALLHIIAELIGLHQRFCHQCIHGEKMDQIHSLLFQETAW